MSFHITTMATPVSEIRNEVGRAIDAELSRLDAMGSRVQVEFAHLLLTAQIALRELVNHLPAAWEKVSVSIYGHVNPGHAAVLGYSNGSISIGINHHPEPVETPAATGDTPAGCET